MRMRLLLCSLLLALPAAHGQDVVIYRCTDAAGALTVQNDVPCPNGSQQQRRVMENAPAPTAPPPAYIPPAPVVAAPQPEMPAVVASEPASATTTGAAIADANRLPPPALFECRTYSNQRYLSDDGNPPQRCAPLQTISLSGDPAMGAGQACEMSTDQCQRVPDEGLCEGWQQRLREAESVQRFGRDGNRGAAQADVERIGRIVSESTCGI